MIRKEKGRHKASPNPHAKSFNRNYSRPLEVRLGFAHVKLPKGRPRGLLSLLASVHQAHSSYIAHSLSIANVGEVATTVNEVLSEFDLKIVELPPPAHMKESTGLWKLVDLLE